MIKKLFLGGVLTLWAVSAQAGELAISFSDQTAQIALRQDVIDYDASGRSVFGVRGLYDDRKDTELVSLSFEVMGPLANTGLEIGAGVQGYYVNSGPDDDEMAAGGIGARLRFVPPNVPRASFGGSVYYCPEVLNTMDGEGLWEAEVLAAFQVTPRATVFTSYTKIEADIENKGTRSLDKTLRVGLALAF
jgi:hypothetical protein